MAQRHAVRLATSDDNEALVALAAACPMDGDIGLCIDRAPDFFAVNRLEGSAWRVAVVDGDDGTLVGCVATAERRVWLNGAPATVLYAGDFKVHPAHRDTHTADALQRVVMDNAREVAGDSTPVFLSILGGNRAMQRRIGGPRGLPRMHHCATLASYSIPLLWRWAPSVPRDVRITCATAADLEDMAECWIRIASQRQFAPVLDAARLRDWIEAAPGLALGDYLLARDARGQVVGFMAAWDQRSIRSLRVTRYTGTAALLRGGMRVLGPLLGAPPMPAVGAPLHHATVLHVCVPPRRPDVLRALVLTAHGRLRDSDRVFLNITLDARDPLGVALHGLLAARTTLGAYVMSGTNAWSGARLGPYPLHFETVFV